MSARNTSRRTTKNKNISPEEGQGRNKKHKRGNGLNKMDTQVLEALKEYMKEEFDSMMQRSDEVRKADMDSMAVQMQAVREECNQEVILSKVKDLVEGIIAPINARLPPTEILPDGTSPSPLTDYTNVHTQRTVVVPKASKDTLRNYLRFEWYGEVKFMTDNQASAVLKRGKEQNKIDDKITSHKQVLSALANLRQNSRSNAKACFIGKMFVSPHMIPFAVPFTHLSFNNHNFYYINKNPDAMKGIKGKTLPPGFPNAILPEIGLNGSVQLKDNYRKYKEGDGQDEEAEEQFVWFLENIVAKINPRKNDYGSRSPHRTVSEIFHHSDEAWGLMILLNEYDVWEWDANKQMSDDQAVFVEQNPKPKSKFTSRENTDSKKQWSLNDIETLREISSKVKKVREDNASKEWEVRFKEGKHRKKIKAAAGPGTTNCIGTTTSRAVSIGGDDESNMGLDLERVRAREEARQLADDDFAACLRRDSEKIYEA